MQSSPAAAVHGGSYHAAVPPLRCGLEALLSPPVTHCTILDLQGDLLYSNPSTVDGNTTTVFGGNATLHLLASALRTSTTPRTLLLSGSSSLDDAAVADILAPALRGSSIETLAMEACNVTAAGAAALAHHLVANPTSALRTLSLARNQLGADGATALAQALAMEHAPLRSLHLSATSLGSEGGVALAAALEGGGGLALERLTLDQNALGDEGAEALARALAAASAIGGGRLSTLDLSGNLIGPRGAAALGRTLTRVASRHEPAAGGPLQQPSRAARLRHLLLDGNAAGDEGAAALARAVASHPTLRSMSLHANAISRAGGGAFERALGHGRGLESLHGLPQGNDLPRTQSGTIEALVARNRHAHERGGGAPFSAAGEATKANEDSPPSGRDTHLYA